MDGQDRELGDASGTGLLCAEVNHDPSDLAVIAPLEMNCPHLLEGGTCGVPTNTATLVTPCEGDRFYPDITGFLSDLVEEMEDGCLMLTLRHR